ncbi:hypothetical protein HMI56_001762 [Coelomomyces lativittatus]|nr:hypothetical protein HMI56_001762 [Coelomomyces lativittatus]
MTNPNLNHKIIKNKKNKMTSLSTSTTTTTTTTTTTHPHPSLQKIINLHQVIQTSSSFEKLQDQHVTPHWVALDELSLFLEDLRKEKVNFMKEKKALVNYLLNLQNSIQQVLDSIMSS